MKKTFKVSAASILFYVAAVVFLGIAVFYIWQTYVIISNYADSGQNINISAMLDNYFTYCSPYFAYAIICYGLGVVMGKLTSLTHVMSLCLVDAKEENEKEVAAK